MPPRCCASFPAANIRCSARWPSLGDAFRLHGALCAAGRGRIQRYLLTREYTDKAGGYAIQGHAGAFIEHISGSYSGVMGLPLFETVQLLRHFDYPTP
jgi:hypothetical protein